MTMKASSGHGTCSWAGGCRAAHRWPEVCTSDDCNAEPIWVPACAALDPTSVLHDAPCTAALLDGIAGEACPGCYCYKAKSGAFTYQAGLAV